MDRLYERQTEILCYLNDHMVEPTPELEEVAKIIGIEITDIEKGWYIPDEQLEKC